VVKPYLLKREKQKALENMEKTWGQVIVTSEFGSQARFLVIVDDLIMNICLNCGF